MIGQTVAEFIPFNSFKEKIQLTKKLKNMGKMEVLSGGIYISYYTKNLNNRFKNG